jgi:DNA polymerase-3 subunit delta
MDSRTILNELKDRQYKPVYFLMGEETFFIDEVSSYINDHILSETEKEFDQTVVYGKDTDVSAVVGMAKRFPMMSPNQVVIVREAQTLKNIESLEAYIKNPQPSTLLVIEYKYKKIDKRKAFYKALKKHAVLLESDKMYDNKIPGWIEDYTMDHGYKIGPKSAALIAESLGNDLTKISNELQKVFINIKKGDTINEEIIENNIGISKDFNVFELQTAITRKDVLKANQIVKYFADNPKEHPFVVTITVLYNFFSKVLMTHYSENKEPRSLASTLGVNPFFVKDYIAASKNYRPAKVVKIISHLRIYDLRFKGVDNLSTTEGELLKELMFKILH